MREIVQQLLCDEAAAEAYPELPISAAHRVLEALRQPLSTLVGFQGYRVLLARALTLAKAKDPLLHAVTIQPDGSLLGLSETNAETSEAGIVLTRQLLQLLATFIGKELTLHILIGVWPNLTIPSTTSSQERKDDQAK
jgi:hypothetical protein